ncbi:hypothetical protein ABZW30_41045 [Kitasatospora sp. NPDC004669]|uniref:hypothetical protein n=1 Tax=Kitasatospora sp. NPDC004669 TaxID=3154555 RepID=UPI0033BEA3DA
MAEHSYENITIELPDFGAPVRRPPRMFFGADRGDQNLAAHLLSAIGKDLLHPPASVASAHALQARLEVTGDRGTTVTVNQPHAWERPRLPVPRGWATALLGDEWWSLCAAAALSAEVTVERWCGGQGARQRLAGLRPLADIEEFRPSDCGSGLRVSATLDPAHVGTDFLFPMDLAELNLHDPDCSVSPGTGHVLIRDHRSGLAAGDVLHR